MGSMPVGKLVNAVTNRPAHRVGYQDLSGCLNSCISTALLNTPEGKHTLYVSQQANSK